MPTPPMSSSSSERRRQWLISHGLLSPSSGPSRRLGGLLPRVGAPSGSIGPGSSGRASVRSADVDVRVAAERATPVVIARASQERPPRAVSMPSADGPAPPPVARAASTRVGCRDRAASPPRRRFFRRRGRRMRPEDERRKEGRQVVTVVDRELPRKVLRGKGDPVTFDGTRWNEYRERIDGLKEDRRFMDYLTEGVAERRVDARREAAVDDTQQLAVNKLYPLAFIRLLEAQARFQDEDEHDDPEEEKHRYDDPDVARDDEDKVVRTASSGVYDIARFRTVGGNSIKRERGRQSDELVSLIEGRKNDPRKAERPVFLARMGRESRIASVPVC